MPPKAPSISMRQYLRLRHSSLGRLVADSMVLPAISHDLASKPFHTASARAQAVEVASHTQMRSVTSTTEPQGTSAIARQAGSLTREPETLSSEWLDRLNLLSLKAVAGHQSVPSRIVIVGTSLSQTQHLLASMIDEPLREISSSQSNEAEVILSALVSLPASTQFTIKYAPGPVQLLDTNVATLDRHWLLQSNLDITVLLDPAPVENTYDLIYDSEAVLFVTDDYALSHSAHRSTSSDERGNVMRELLSRFASKPNTTLAVNSLLGLDLTQVVAALEAATGSSVAEHLVPNLVSVRVADALAANASLRQALQKPEQQPSSQLATGISSTAYWDSFSDHYQRSNVGALIETIQSLGTPQGNHALVAQSAAFLLQHCLDEAMATVKRNMACLYQLRTLATEAKEREESTLKQSLERIWPPSIAYTGQLLNDEINVWRPASPGSSSAVDEALRHTDELLESTFDTKLQWWKLVWKVDDIRKELETACAGFAASLEADLAYESGRLATLQVEQVRAADQLLRRFRKLAQELGPGIASASRDVALLTNQAEAYRSSRLRTIEPSTLREPIDRRRAQLLQTGGPIDELATKSRKLAVTSSAAVVVTAAGVGSASVLGSSLALDASSAALALDPSTGIGLGLLTLTLVGWRMQGQYNKYRRRFREDWQRLAEGLDQDLKRNFEAVLRQQITGPSSQASSRILALCQTWSQSVHQQEKHVRAVSAQKPHLLDAPQHQKEDSKIRQ